MGRFPQTGYAGDKLRRYLKFRAQPGRKLSQGRGWAFPLYAGYMSQRHKFKSFRSNHGKLFCFLSLSFLLGENQVKAARISLNGLSRIWPLVINEA